MLTILQGDATEKLRELPDESVQCCVTSPPYWGLRDYGTAAWEAGDTDCDHLQGMDFPRSSRPLGAFHGGDDRFHASPFKDVCRKCGAKRIDSQIGLEETPDAYVAKIVEIFREVRRVLCNDGTLWLNLGDSYVANGGGGEAAMIAKGQPSNSGFRSGILDKGAARAPTQASAGLRPKNLVGIPWRVAFALQADGWYLRSDIIWHKPNPMPESVTDRPTKAHEYLFLLSKSERYFYDAEAINEPAAKTGTLAHLAVGNGVRAGTRDGLRGAEWIARKRLQDPVSQALTESEVLGDPPAARNKRSVWTVPTAPYAEAHFATYPPDLIKPCIMAGSKLCDTILDPFAGSGTTGAVAIELGRKAILIELNPQYIPLIEARCTVTPGFL